MAQPKSKRNSGDKAVRRALEPVISIAAFLAIASSAVSAADKFLNSVLNNTAIAAFIFYIALAGLTWNIRLLTFLPYRTHVAPYRLHAVFALTVVFIAVLFGEPAWLRLRAIIFPQTAEPPRLTSMLIMGSPRNLRFVS